VRAVLLALAVALSIGCLTACGGDPAADLAAPENGACRDLTPSDVAEPTDDTATVPCEQTHTAETFAVGEVPASFDDADWDDAGVGEWAATTCTSAFKDFLGADVSLVMRTVLSWAWFRPSEDAWDQGARWYRCDVVGGGEQSKSYVALPTTAKDLLAGKPQDEWMVCAVGRTVAGAVKVPCTEPHEWRAVTTISLGDPADKYPGDKAVESTTQDFCSQSVGAWLNYPVDYDYGYTWFQEPEWDAGNRRSVCWAKTEL
jgi:hypothetical protein